MNEKPLTLKEINESAARAADEIEKNWPQWKKDLSKILVICIEMKDGREIKRWTRTE